jgi:hypothetical protein
MDRPKIEEFLEACKKKTPGPWLIDTCNNGESCWCRLVITASEPTNNWRDNCIIPDGSVSKNDAEFIASAGTNAESIAQYAIDKEQKAALMEKAFEIRHTLGNDCPSERYGICRYQKAQSCGECRKNYSLAEAGRQLKEENHD